MLIIGFVVSGLIAVAAWIILARACRNGSNWARITGTVLFALATIDTIVGVRAPLAVAVRAWWPVIWLAGLAAVIFLWQGASTAWTPRASPGSASSCGRWPPTAAPSWSPVT